MKLLALVESPEHVCCRYRIRAFSAALEAAGWSVNYQSLAPGVVGRVRQLQRAAQFDAVILQRRLLPAWQLGVLRHHARHLIFDFDDAVLFRDSYDPRGIQSRRRLGRFMRTVRMADAIIAGNDFLADCALRAGGKVDQVIVIPTCVEPGIYPDSSQHAVDSADLVWVGSSSTLKGLEQARPIWNAIAKSVADVRMRILCDRFPSGFPMRTIEVPWQEATEASEIASAQIGVAWLPDDDWSRGKCGLKVLQYQAAGLPVIANPVGVHAEMVVHGETGFLCKTPEQWSDAVARLAADSSLRAQMGLLARRRVELGYSVAAWSQTFVRTVAEVDGTATELAPSPSSSRPYSVKRPSTRDLNPIGNR